MKDNGWLPMLREGFAGVIAIIFVVTFLMLVKAAYTDMQNPARFGAAKELLGIVNGIVGIIIGYYFSRMTTEARAEKAEETAKDAVGTAADAVQKERNATDQVVAITADASQKKVALARLRDAAQDALGASAGGGKSAVRVSATVDPAVALRLTSAIAEADRVL
jgi:hypothetical protein